MKNFTNIIEKFHNIDWIINGVLLILYSILQILITKLIINFIYKLIKKSLKLNTKLDERKKETLKDIFSSTIKYILYFIVLCNILSNFGINISSLITVASIGSIAIGLGSKSLILDIINGMFILFEDQFGVGDIVSINSLEGTVETIGIRTTHVRSFEGNLYIIPNGTIKMVTNMSKGYNCAKVDINIAYKENIDNVIKVLENEMNEIFKNNKIDGLIKTPSILGIEELNNSSVVLRILANTNIGQNWQVERELRKHIKNRLEKENIEIS